MNRTCIGITALACICAAAFVSAQQKKAGAGTAKAGDAALIRSAMSAAPAAVSRDATIIDVSADGKMRTVRKGTNGFTCMPDDPHSPGVDPMCMDQAGMDWLMALMTTSSRRGRSG